MQCPFCQKTIKKGIIYGDRYALKWIEESRDKGLIASTFQKGIKITNPWTSNKVKVHYCKDCEKMVINLSNSDEE